MLRDNDYQNTDIFQAQRFNLSTRIHDNSNDTHTAETMVVSIMTNHPHPPAPTPRVLGI
jgi:hypothetical protein